MALRVLEENDLLAFPVGAHVEGIVNLNREKYPVQARVRHVGPELVGFEFENLTESVSSALNRFLDPSVLGTELKPIPSNENSLWYHGPSGTDVYLWRGVDGSYKRIAIVVLASFIQWDETSGISTGQIESSFEPSEVRGVVRFETLLLKPDAAIDSRKLAIAKTLLQSSQLPQDLKAWCVRQLKPSN